MTAVSFDQWGQIRAACELLGQIATVQALRGVDAGAVVALEWIEHMRGVAEAKQEALAALPGCGHHAGGWVQ